MAPARGNESPDHNDDWDDDCDDDWAPLPAESLPDSETDAWAAARSERTVPKPLLRPARRPTDGAPPPLSRPNLEGERMLRELQQRLAERPKATDDPVRRALARATQKTMAKPLPLSDEDPEPAAVAAEPIPDGATIAYAIDRDPREDEPWFRLLPERERHRLSAKWRAARHQHGDRGRDVRRELLRSCGHGSLLFALPGLALTLFVGFAMLPRMMVAGAVAGLLGRIAGGGRIVFALAGTLCGCLGMGEPLLLSPIGLGVACLCAYGMALVGYDREIRQAGGFGSRA